MGHQTNRFTKDVGTAAAHRSRASKVRLDELCRSRGTAGHHEDVRLSVELHTSEGGAMALLSAPILECLAWCLRTCTTRERA